MKSIPVFYRPEMAQDSGGYSPSGLKPRQVVTDWQQRQLAVDVREFRPVTERQLGAVHDPRHVTSILDGRQENGHGNLCPEVTNSCLYTCGSMVAAGLEAVQNGKVACSPSSGFHHAGYDYSGGFCTFNGLMLTAREVINRTAVGRVGILDGDAHYPDGCHDIQQRFDSPVLIESISSYRTHQEWCNTIRRFVRLCHRQEVGLLLYQAGADAHQGDPLRAGFLTTEEMRERDQMVFRLCRNFGIPVAWNLAGGYQRAPDGSIPFVLELHRNTMQECLATYCCEQDAPERMIATATHTEGNADEQHSGERVL